MIKGAETQFPRQSPTDCDFAIEDRFQMHRHSSVEIFTREVVNQSETGMFIVEEISDEDQESDVTLPDDVVDVSPEKSPVKCVEQIRRDFGNISPISEDIFYEADQVMEPPQTPLSANASAELSFITRLNCSSPILSHSPSLRKTPVSTFLSQETPPNSSGGGRRVRNIARALDDIISDKEEASEEDEEETESFDIDLAGGSSDPLNLLRKDSLRATKEDSLNIEEEEMDKVDEDSFLKEAFAGLSVGSEGLDSRKTVWETLSSNIKAHIYDGNDAGFVSGPIDHPVNVPPPGEPGYPSFTHYTEPVAALPESPK